MNIDLCLFCYNYQRRLSWMLSSIAQQIGDIPRIILNIASLRNNGNPLTEDIVHIFRQYFEINHIVYDTKEECTKRGIVRNRQIQETKSEWIFFADADHVYPVSFFADLKSNLELLSDSYSCITSISKHYTKTEETNALVDATQDIVIDSAYQKASALPFVEKHERRVAGGSMQVIRRNALMNRNQGRYVDPRACKDADMFSVNNRRYFSDVNVRENLNRTNFINLEPQIHLNHFRNWECGKIMEEQK